MFKSIFAKYVSAFMLIILFSFLVIIFIISSIISSYSTDAKSDIMENAARATSTYVSSLFGDSPSDGIEETVRESENSVRSLLSVIAEGADDITILVSDNSGKIVLAVGQDSHSVADSANIPKAFMDEVNSGNAVSRNGMLEGVFDSPRFVYAVPVYNSNGAVCGTAFVCAESVMLTDLLEVIIKAIIVSILWVLLAALIAVYFITEKITGPLKEISRAAKQFAKGKFDVRVPVRGNDEVAELGNAFNNMADSLESLEKMRNSFLANISHDLRTPMTTIAGFIDGITSGAIPPEKHEYYLNIISGEVHRLSRLVSQILDVSRLESGERKFNKIDFDITEVARLILISFENKIDTKKLDVVFDVEEDELFAFADKDAIYQVLYNLCHNAIKFAKEGGEFRISINRAPGKKLIVSVFDEGQTLTEEESKLIFERFYKTDTSRGLDKTGVGLGLYISKTIIDAHEEDIFVTNEGGRGCKISFTLKEGAPVVKRKRAETV